MIELTLTFSASQQTIQIPSVVDDRIAIHYGECAYCAATMRIEDVRSNPRRRFCTSKDRHLYHYHRIDELTPPVTAAS